MQDAFAPLMVRLQSFQSIDTSPRGLVYWARIERADRTIGLPAGPGQGVSMPIYEFRCLKCGHIFEKLFVKAGEEMELACPACRSESFERIISRTNYVMGGGKEAGKPKLTTRSCHPGSDCTTLEIPGCD